MPISATVCGLPAALSVMLNVALRLPAAVGVNVTMTWQLSFGARVGPQVWVSRKFASARGRLYQCSIASTSRLPCLLAWLSEVDW